MIVEGVLTLGFLFLVWIIVTKRKHGLPPGPMPFPVIGNLPQLALSGAKRPYAAFHNLAKKHGNIMTLRMGAADVVVLSSYEVMRDVLGKEEWSGRIFEESLKARYLNQRLGILFLEGEAYKDQRRFLLRHLKDLGFGKQNSMESMISVELHELTSRLRQRMADGRQAVVCMHNYFNLSVLNVLWSMIAGTRYSHDDEKLLALLEHVDMLMKCGSVGNLSSMFPILRKLAPKLTGEEKQLEAYKLLQNFLRELIQEKKEIEDGNPEKCFLDIYLKEIDKFQGDSTSLYTEDQLVMLCFDMLLAGSETTSNSLCFAILYMMLYPQVQDEVHKELVGVVGTANTISLDYRHKLPYTQAVLMEVLRLSNVSPAAIPHTIMERDAIYKDYKIPKDTIVMINLYSVHMNKEHWIDPEAFRPERFLHNGRRLIKDEHVIPFGVGKRSCLGESLAQSSLFLYFTTLVMNFKFETVPGHLSPSEEPVLGFTLSPMPYNTVVTCRR
ncbi:Methyl farnesoate epoxidase [Orchesella cincta]|uniref:Methyl farnesoate epoxidase n=1 Tax=Orchesella cincta TaxID=48709 RepID=A0A1D2N0F8_ORCCI|nr:Methyl farnesoate epoxidase [Orchesella cincta]